jgi:hypothetical protein
MKRWNITYKAGRKTHCRLSLGRQSPSVCGCSWGGCLAAIAIAYLSQVPVYVNGSGVVLEQDASVLLIFIPTSPSHPLQIHAGAPVHLQIGTPDQTINSTIDQVETGVLSPEDAQKRYGLGDKVPQIITGPSIVASVKLNAAFLSPSYEGSVVNVQVQVGTTRILSLLLGFATPNGE